MAERQRAGRQSASHRDIVVWAGSDGSRCILASLGEDLELRLEYEGVVYRQARYGDVRPACEAAQLWRVDWDIESQAGGNRRARIACPECAGEMLRETDAAIGIEWWQCASCGESWVVERGPRQ